MLESQRRVARQIAWPVTLALVVVDVLIGTLFRFTSTSKLWLDEALSVNIARHSLGQIVHLLKHDGAPPLYYVLLHFWMTLVGDGDTHVRALSGVFSVLTLPVVYLLLRKVWGAQAALLGVGLAAVFPFATYYATETRMYSLVMLLSTILVLLVVQVLERPSATRIGALAVVFSLLLYTHYWAIYLGLTLGLYALLLAWRQRSLLGSPARILGALAGGGVLWLPWLSVFNEQRLHTGTPWTAPPGIWQALTWPEAFVVNQSTQHVTVSFHMIVELFAFVILVVLGAMALKMTPDHFVHLDLRGNADARLFVNLGVGSIVVGITAAHFGHSAFVPRYASVAALLVLFLAVRGITTMSSATRVLLVFALFSGASLWTDNWGRKVQRTQSGQVAAALASAPSGSLVFVCPDQLGPSLLRYAPADLHYVGYPRLNKPDIVNWYDYLDAVNVESPQSAALKIAAMAKSAPAVYVVWASGYTLRTTCHDAMVGVQYLLKAKKDILVTQNLTGFYQSMTLDQLIPTR